MRGSTLKERKKNTQLGELLGLEPVSLVIKIDRLIWFGHTNCKDNDKWGTSWRGHRRNTWWSCISDNMKSFVRMLRIRMT